MVCLYVCGAVVFGAIYGAHMHDPHVLARALLNIPDAALLILAAAMFGTAMFCVFRGRAAAPISVLVLMTPFIIIWFSLILQNAPLPPLRVLNAIGSVSPPLIMSYSLKQLSRVLLYTGVMAAVAVLLADRRIGRRA
jgi:hypothetical protein